jgi:hypothetical protein
MEAKRRVVRGRSLVMSGLAVLAALSFAVAPAAARPGDDGPGRGRADVFAPDARPFGQTYAEWSIEWWTWALQNGEASFADTTGANCALGQSERRVWFLAGSFSSDPVTRNCTVTDDMALLFPVVNSGYFGFPTDPPEQQTDEFARVSALAGLADRELLEPTLHASIDGEPVRDLASFFVESGPFSVKLPLDNFFGFPSPLKRSADAGYYLMVKKLHRGEHTIHFGAHGRIDVTVHLNVLHH